MNYIIKPVPDSTWNLFQSCLNDGPCCRPAFPSTMCYGLFVGRRHERIAAMIWYTWPYKNSPFRAAAIKELRGMGVAAAVDYINKNVCLLARISTLPKYRGNGYAAALIKETIPLCGVKYVECLTAHDDVRKLLARCGFLNIECKCNLDYWLYTSINHSHKDLSLS